MNPLIFNSRRFLFLILGLLLTAVSFASDPQKAVDEFIRNNGINPSSVAVKITELSDKKTLGEHNSSHPLVPASIMKSVTTAALLGESGPDYRYITKVSIDGPLDMGILRGNLIIEGNCDPSLNSNVEPYGTDIVHEITEALEKSGITVIEGDIIIDEQNFAGRPRPASWQKADFSQSYGTGSHAFNFENNASGRRSVENPSAVFLGRLKSAFSKAGITVRGNDLGYGERSLLFNHYSPTIDEIMRSCMMRSDNLFAESMLRTYGKLTGGDGSTEDAAGRATDMWSKKKMPMSGVTIIDGSGLSRSNHVTADFMTSVLSSMSDNEVYASFFPLAGEDGTLKSFLVDTPLAGYIAMKTGSMKGIQCYAGYLLDENYVPTHTVVIIMNDITGSRDKAKKAAQKMLLKIFEEKAEQEEENVNEIGMDIEPEFEEVVIEESAY